MLLLGEVAQRRYCNLSPRGGEKGPCQGSSSGGFCCNLSPQGDGNSLPMIATTLSISLQFIPARGRKRHINPRFRCFRIAIPVRGRKLHNPHTNAFYVQLRLIPVRGRKLDVALVCVTLDLLQFIPARGQKSTSAIGVCQQRRCFAFSYILFYRLGAAPAGIVFVTGSALTPCGTSGFMERISCR